ncbi:hypothetical protein LguiA_019525 [Lonicera macranthoides]
MGTISTIFYPKIQPFTPLEGKVHSLTNEWKYLLARAYMVDIYTCYHIKFRPF